MPKQHNVLVFPGGTEIGLEINRSLRFSKEVRLFSAGIAVSNHADLVFDDHTVIPPISDPNWLNVLNELIDSKRIDYIFPAYDDVLLALAEHKDQLHAKLITSPVSTCRIARFKLETYDYLCGDLPVPIVYPNSEAIPRFPVYLKPNKGQGSQRTYKALDYSEVENLLAHQPDLLVMEYLPGKEYTVDCFSDRDAGLLFCSARERLRTRSGIAMHSRLISDPTFHEYAIRISNKLEFHGAWFFQVRRAIDGTLKLLEIAPRIAGCMALNRVLGVNFPILSLYEQERVPISILTNKFPYIEIDRALANRYRSQIDFENVYVDLDDTLLLRDKINTLLIQFLFQCINKKKKIILLTKHRLDLDKTLANHRIAGLFDKIIQVIPEQDKTVYIDSKNAIFIDDSFRERLAVDQNSKIPTFDSSMIEMLLDERQ